MGLKTEDIDIDIAVALCQCIRGGGEELGTKYVQY